MCDGPHQHHNLSLASFTPSISLALNQLQPNLWTVQFCRTGPCSLLLKSKIQRKIESKRLWKSSVNYKLGFDCHIGTWILSRKECFQAHFFNCGLIPVFSIFNLSISSAFHHLHYIGRQASKNPRFFIYVSGHLEFLWLITWVAWIVSIWIPVSNLEVWFNRSILSNIKVCIYISCNVFAQLPQILHDLFCFGFLLTSPGKPIWFKDLIRIRLILLGFKVSFHIPKFHSG